jgi:hypothetical protein
MEDPRWALTQRVLASPHLSSSPKLSEFLQYVVDCRLRDAPEEATEQQIGVHVFHRIPGYNSSDDSIVRSQARLLRLKLAAYFANEGSNEDLIVEIPKGHYLPSFRSATPVAAQEPEPVRSDTADEVLEESSTTGTPVSRREGLGWRVVAALALTCLLIGACLGYFLGRRSSVGPRVDVGVFWGPFFRDDPPLVIYSNPLFKGTPYTGLKLVPKGGAADSREFSGVADETYTGTGEATAIYELARIFDTHRASFTLKRSRLVTWDEAKLRNLVFVGAPSQNGALNDLPATSDFVIDLDANEKGYITNRRPEAGEPKIYSPATPNDEYAILALIPGVQGGHRIAIFTGLTTNGTQAAVEFACNPENVRQLAARAGQVGGVIKPFEAVLHIKLSGGVPLGAEVAALHTH